MPTLSQMIRGGQELAARIKRATKEALVEWFAQSERLNIARTHYKLRGDRFADFANRIGVDRASAYQLVKLWKHRTAILNWCRDEGRYYGWETCLYWFEKAPRGLWHCHQDDKYINDEYATPPSVFGRFGSACTLDVCATTGKAMCAEYFSKAQDGLKRRWHGTVWMNPPYSDLYPWCAKAYEYAQTGGTVIALQIDLSYGIGDQGRDTGVNRFAEKLQMTCVTVLTCDNGMWPEARNARRRGRGRLPDEHDQCLLPQRLSAHLPARKAVVGVAWAQRHYHRRVGWRPRAGGPPFV